MQWEAAGSFISHNSSQVQAFHDGLKVGLKQEGGRICGADAAGDDPGALVLHCNQKMSALGTQVRGPDSRHVLHDAAYVRDVHASKISRRAAPVGGGHGAQLSITS